MSIAYILSLAVRRVVLSFICFTFYWHLGVLVNHNIRHLCSVSFKLYAAADFCS